MKKLIILSFVVLMAAVACTTGPFKDIRIGKNYGVLFPKKVLVHTAPSLNSRAFKLDVSEAFLVEDVMCADGKSILSCWSDLAVSKDNPQLAQVAFYKVRFESGKVGYINAGYFYPKLSNSLVSENIAAVGGETPSEYMARVRSGREAIRVEAKERFERQRQSLIDKENDRRSEIAASSWSAADKELILNHGVRIGMTREQLMYSKDMPPNIGKSVTAEGEFEDWFYEDTTYYFKNDKLIRWKTKIKAPGR